MTERHVAVKPSLSGFVPTKGTQEIPYPLPVIVDVTAPDKRSQDTWRPALALIVLLVMAAGALFHVLSDTQRPILGPAPDEATMGAVLAAGGLYHADADRLNHRALIASRIRHLRETPDVAVIADRSWQLLQQDLRWQRNVFGAYVDGLSPADIQSMLDDFDAVGHVPGTIVLGISPNFLMRNDTELKLESVIVDGDMVVNPDTVRSAAIAPPKDRLPTERPRPGIAPYHATLDTIFPDGSVVWSTKRSRDLAQRDTQTDVTNVVRGLRQKVKTASSDQIVETGEIIADVKSDGIEVIIALTPLHPAVYGPIYNQSTAFHLEQGVEDLLAIARALDVTTLGSFEPFAAGCKTADFASSSVPGASCLSRLLNAGFFADPVQSLREQVLSQVSKRRAR